MSFQVQVQIQLGSHINSSVYSASDVSILHIAYVYEV